MGAGLLDFWQTKLKKEHKIAFLSTFVIALLIHLYKFTNTLFNHDSVYNYFSNQDHIGSGRWAASAACLLSSYYDLPWISGLLACIYMALAVVVIVALFKLKNPILIGLVGALIAASISTTETFFYIFVADGFMFAMFLAALGVYFSRIEERRFSRLIISMGCICIACGIYQAYVSFALVLAVCYFMDALLQNKYAKEEYFRWIIHQIVIYILALAAYYIIWKLCMYFGGTVANDYQGISEVGKISVEILVAGLFKAIRTVVLYFLQWNIFVQGFSVYSILNILFLIAMVIGLVIACSKSGIWERKWALVLVGLCLLAVIPFACMWFFTSPTVEYRPRMLQSLTLLFIMLALLYERWAKNLLKDVVCILLITIVFNNTLIANVCYFHLNQCYEKTYADGMEMIMEIHDLQDEYELDKIAVVGNRYDEVNYQPRRYMFGNMQLNGNEYILSGLLEQNLLYDQEHTVLYLRGTFGLDLESLDIEQCNELLQTEEVQEMGCWPAGDSIMVMDDVLVLKLSER